MKFLLLISIFFSCESTKPTSVQGDTITVKLNETFKIQLPTAIGTGYTWVLVDSTANPHVKLLRKQYEEVPAEPDGKPGVDIFTFSALKQGRTELHFGYTRLWEKPRSYQKKKSFVVIIN